MKFIHITDFHLPPPGTVLWGLDPQDRVSRCLDDIARWHGDAEFCVILGDLADKGESEAYRWLSKRLSEFPLPTFVIPGNHDDREALSAAFPDVSRDENGFLQFVHPTAEGVFLFLDTLKGPVSEGAYCAARRNWLAGQLATYADDPVWIFMHHPPFDIGIPYMDRIKLEEADAFADVLTSHKNVRHLFFGHVHRAVFVQWRGIPCTALPGTSHRVPLKRESVGTPYSVEPPMYGIVLVDGEQTTVHLDACLDRAPADMEAG